MDYVDLYISYVYERGNSLEPVETKNTPPPNVTQTQHNGATRYDIHLALKFQNRTTQSHVQVTQAGGINVITPIAVSFLGQIPAGAQTINAVDNKTPYRHPQESEIREQIHDLLSITNTGRMAIRTAQTLGADIRILTSPAYQMFCTDTRTAYITMPITEQNAKYTQAIHYIGAVHDIALSLNDKHYRPAPFQATPALDNEAAMMHMTKNLELALEMCKK